MDFDKKEINNLINDWIRFREDEKLSTLTEEDKKHMIHYKATTKEVLDKVPDNLKKYISDKLEHLTNQFFDHCDYYNTKYYKAGFGDCLSLIIGTLGGDK